MTTVYRVYFVSEDGHVVGPPELISCSKDAEAVARAQQIAAGARAELWDEGRLVAKLPPADGSE